MVDQMLQTLKSCSVCRAPKRERGGEGVGGRWRGGRRGEEKERERERKR